MARSGCRYWPACCSRRFDLALGAVTLIAGANVTTEILKFDLFTRPDLSQGANSLPSGHTTVGLSIARAAVIVAPSAWRSTVALGVSATAALVGVALVLGRWHRPSDVIAATFVCVMWAAVGLAAAALVGHHPPAPARSVSVHVGALIGASAVGGLLVSWGVRPQPGMRPRAGHHLARVHRARLRGQCGRGRSRGGPLPWVGTGRHTPLVRV